MEDWRDKLAQLGDELKASEPTEEPVETDNTDEVPAVQDKKRDTLHIVVEKKGRKGKTATIIEGFSCDDEELAGTARTLRQKIGVGGSSRGGEILLQGDCRDKAAAILKSLGFKVKGV